MVRLQLSDTARRRRSTSLGRVLSAMPYLVERDAEGKEVRPDKIRRRCEFCCSRMVSRGCRELQSPGGSSLIGMWPRNPTDFLDQWHRVRAFVGRPLLMVAFARDGRRSDPKYRLRRVGGEKDVTATLAASVDDALARVSRDGVDGDACTRSVRERKWILVDGHPCFGARARNNLLKREE